MLEVTKHFKTIRLAGVMLACASQTAPRPAKWFNQILFPFPFGSVPRERTKKGIPLEGLGGPFVKHPPPVHLLGERLDVNTRDSAASSSESSPVRSIQMEHNFDHDSKLAFEV